MARRSGAWLRLWRASAVGHALGARLGAGYIRLVHATTRWQVEGRGHLDAVLARDGGVIGGIWHGRLFLSPTWATPGRHAVAMISQARDGDLIAAIVGRFGVRAVRGSTYDRVKHRDKGGAQALAEACAEIRERGALLAITPDGPRGPRMRAQPGIARIAVETGAPVLPMAFSVRRGILARSWDRFLVPLPFGRGAQVFGAPLLPPAPGDAAAEQAFLAAIEAAITAVTQRADALCGRPPVEPAPPPPDPAPSPVAAAPPPGEVSG